MIRRQAGNTDDIDTIDDTENIDNTDDTDDIVDIGNDDGTSDMRCEWYTVCSALRARCVHDGHVRP